MTNLSHLCGTGMFEVGMGVAASSPWHLLLTVTGMRTWAHSWLFQSVSWCRLSCLYWKFAEMGEKSRSGRYNLEDCTNVALERKQTVFSISFFSLPHCLLIIITLDYIMASSVQWKQGGQSLLPAHLRAPTPEAWTRSVCGNTTPCTCAVALPTVIQLNLRLFLRELPLNLKNIGYIW